MFRIGEVEGVKEFVLATLPGLTDRLQLLGDDACNLERLFLASLTAATEAMPRFMEEPFAPAIPAGRELFDWLGRVMLTDDSQLVGSEHVARALELQQCGANVLLLSNHTSGADHPAMEYLVNREFGMGVTHPWVYMSGHVVNYFLVPLMLSGGINRVQIVSSRYRSVSRERGDGLDRWMFNRNLAALRYLSGYTKPGGRFVVMYPEGGRGDGALKLGDPHTMAIPTMMAKCGQPLHILPCFVDGATSVLPLHREAGESEFNEVLLLARRGTVNVRFGAPVKWCDLTPTCSADLGVADSCATQDRSMAEKMYLLGRVMELIANLAPTEEAKGPYGSCCRQ